MEQTITPLVRRRMRERMPPPIVRPVRVTEEQLAMRRFTTIVFLFLLTLAAAESTAKSAINVMPSPQSVENIQTGEAGIKFQRHVLKVVHDLSVVSEPPGLCVRPFFQVAQTLH
jgi:hypothetical protein